MLDFGAANGSRSVALMTFRQHLPNLFGPEALGQLTAWLG